MRIYFFSSLAGILACTLGNFVYGQGAMRGMGDQVDLNAANRHMQNELIVEEIEDAGFTLDVEEGFEEEWEEDIWASSEEEFGTFDIDPAEAVIADQEDVIGTTLDDEWEEVLWEEDIDEAEIDLETASWDESADEVVSDEALDLEEDSDFEDFLLEDVELVEDNLEEAYDPGFQELLEEMEFDELEFEMEEDLDLLEELYFSN